MIKIDQWMGAKGITIEIDTYGFLIFPSILSRYRNRHYFKPNYLHEIFSIRKNLRDVICDWSLDITILGLTFQFNKYKEWMLKNLIRT